MMRSGILACLLVMILVAGARGEGQVRTIGYEADDAVFANPERGFYKPFNPPHTGKMGGQEKPHAPLKVEELKPLRAEGITLVRDYVLIPRKYWGGAISPEYMAELQANLDAVREAGMKVILRFLYDWSMNNRDPDEATINGHLDQLKPLLEKNGDVIAWVQAGLFGGCGEGGRSDRGYVKNVHAVARSKYLWPGLMESGRRVYLRELSIVPQDRMMTVRYPRYKWDLFEWTAETAKPLTAGSAFDGSGPARVGFYNHGFMGDENHYAMFQLPGEREYMAGESQFVVSEGEISKATAYNMKKGQVVADMAKFHQTALNFGGDGFEKVVAAWKENGDFDEVTRRLGYRLRLVEAKAPKTVAPGGEFILDLEMVNDGFAGVMNPRAVEVVLAGKDRAYMVSVEDGRGNRAWFPGAGETKKLRVAAGLPADAAVGEYRVFLVLPDPAERLRGRAEYAIRLANKDVWDEKRGWNDLRAVVKVEGREEGDYAGKLEFREMKR